MSGTLTDCFAERLLQELATTSKLLFVIAGHNGAGKSTYYSERLKEQLAPLLADRHVDPDVIEQAIRDSQPGLPLSPKGWSIKAMRLADEERQSNIEAGANFSFETVFSDSGGHKIAFLQRAMAQGYTVALLFIGLESPGHSSHRVAIRVARGGHGVPEDKIYSRYPRVLTNIKRACGLVQIALLVDNSDESPDGSGRYREVAVYHRGRLVCETDDKKPTWFASFG